MKSNYQKSKKLKNKAIELVLSSTSHGLPNIFRTERKSLKIMWFILFVVALSVGIYTVFNGIISYLNYDVVTKIDVIDESKSEFPAVTFFILKNPKANISLDDLLCFCQFNSEYCTSSDFIQNKDRFGYVSYKFKKKYSYVSGLSFGLQVVINLDKIVYSLGNPNKSINNIVDGLRIIIHNDSNDPQYYFGQSNIGFNIPREYNNGIIIKRVFSTKLGNPYNNCLNNLNSFNSELYKYIIESTNFSYTQYDCFSYCMGRELYKYLNYSKIDNLYNAYLDAISIGKGEDLKSIYYSLIRGEVNTKCSAECPLECDSISYEITNSFTTVISDQFQLLFPNKSLNNSVIFNIYFEDLSFTKISQMAKTDIWDLVSNIGGNSGLFIGISFLSFAEIIELIVEFLFIIMERNSVINVQ